MNKIKTNIQSNKIDEQLSKLFSLLGQLTHISSLDRTEKVSLYRAYDQWYAWIQRTHKSNGWAHAVKLNKFARTCFLRKLAGSPPPSQDVWLKMSKDGLPRVLSSFSVFLKEPKPKYVKYLLTCLFMSRWVECDIGEADYQAISDPGVYTLPQALTSFIQTEYSGLLDIDEIEPVTPILTTSMGPCGPALATSLDELPLLDQELRDDLGYLSNDGHGWLGMYFHNTERHSPSLGFNRGEPEIRRLQVINDKEGKKRVIAIFDYWSQSVLKPLHSALAGLLKRNERDCTFNQSNFTRILSEECPTKNQTYFSVDLKGATDRMPAKLQAYLLAVLTGDSNYGRAWLRTMIGRPFKSPVGQLSYGVGQPMGAYSSWPMMALTHHAILEYCRQAVGNDGEYYVLGDDVIIQGESLFKEYQSVIRSLGMELNRDKTFESKRFFEFAKRFFLNNEECSPFPLGSVLRSKGDLSLMLPALTNSYEKSWLQDIGSSTRIELFRGMLKTFSRGNGCTRYAASLLAWAYELQLYTNWIQKGVAARPWGLTQLAFACTRSEKGHAQFMGYILDLNRAELAKKLLKQTRWHIHQVSERLDDSLAAYQDHSHLTIEDENGDLQPCHPILDVLKRIENIADEVTHAQYSPDKTVEELNEQWSKHYDLLIEALPDWETINNEKGSARRARLWVDITRRVRKSLEEYGLKL